VKTLKTKHFSIQATKSNWKQFYKKFSLLLSAHIFVLNFAHSAQWGPVFPSHNFPTERSFLMNSNLEYGTQNSFFNSDGQKQSHNSVLSRFRATLNPEFQPSRELSFGAFFNFDYLSLKPTNTTLFSKSGPSDQFLFGEYRFYDYPGRSVGIASVVKIPAYPIPQKIAEDSSSFLVLGDGQIDVTTLLTTEYWLTKNLKFYLDLGFTYRAEDHSSEIPYNTGLEFKFPRYTIGANLRGASSLKTDNTRSSKSSGLLHDLTGGTNYIFAENPTILIGKIYGEYALNHEWALSGKIENSMTGKNAPFFYTVGFGLSYRNFEYSRYIPRTAREVDIDTDDSGDEFEGEIQENYKKSPDTFESDY
jgi:hypothetical protein